jgi:hypothetical protein
MEAEMPNDAIRRRAKAVVLPKFKRRTPVRPLQGAQCAVLQAGDHGSSDDGPKADTTAIANTGSEIAVADNSWEPGVNAHGMKNAAVAEVKFPLCNAAVQKIARGDWGLADAIVAECSEVGEDGVRNGSNAKMKAMREEIAKNHGVELSLERIRKLRKVASAFSPGRRRPCVSLEGHLEAGTPDALDELVQAAPAGTALTRDYIRQQKYPTAKAEQDHQKAERRHQIEDQRTALQNVCRQLEREKEEREQRYTDLCRSIGKEPEPFSPPLSPEAEPSLTVREDLERALRSLLMAHGFDPTADNVKRAIEDFARAVLAQPQ